MGATEAALRDRPSSIFTVAIGGPFGGSLTMSLVDRLSFGGFSLSDFLFTSELAEELRPNSSRANELLAAMRDHPPHTRHRLALRAHFFLATLDEMHVWPPTSALPLVSSDEIHYAHVTGVGHSALPEYAMRSILRTLKGKSPTG